MGVIKPSRWVCTVVGPSVPLTLREPFTLVDGSAVPCDFNGTQADPDDDSSIGCSVNGHDVAGHPVLSVSGNFAPSFHLWSSGDVEVDFDAQTGKVAASLTVTNQFTSAQETWQVSCQAFWDLEAPFRSMEIPACSVCGYVVDFLRSCYVGNFRLFRDRPDVITRGRYYFSPIGTLPYPGFHLLGSQTWLDKNLDPVVPLGEVIGPTQWSNGAGPAKIIPSVRVGSKDCISNGEEYKNRISLPLTTDGVPSTCFAQTNRLSPDDEFGFLFDVEGCVTQRFYAQIISLLYDDDQAGITAMFDNLFGPATYDLFFLAADGDRPGHVLAMKGNNACVVSDGTRRFQTLAVQSAVNFTPPTNFGAFGTLSLWYSSASRLIDFLVSHGVTSATNIVLSGHSYGGVVSAIAKARITPHAQGEVPRVLAFGCPKPGDVRLAELLRRPEAVFLSNDDDLVTIIPFGPIQQALLEPTFASQLIFPDWARWSYPIGPVTLLRDGRTDPSTERTFTTSVIVAVTFQFLFSQQLAPIAGHTIGEYARRLALRCPSQT